MMNVRNANHESFKPPHSQLGLVPVDSDPLLHAPPLLLSIKNVREGWLCFFCGRGETGGPEYVPEREERFSRKRES